MVVNAKAATSKGLEFESSGPLGIDGLTYNVGLAYTQARLSEDFVIAANTGAPIDPLDPQSAPLVDPAAIAGKIGDRLPGSPDFSGSVNLNYALPLDNGAKLKFTLGADYRGSTVTILPSINPAVMPSSTIGGYSMLHGNIELTKGAWRFDLYGTNLADRYVVVSRNARPQSSIDTLGGYGDTYTVARPREFGLRVSRDW